MNAHNANTCDESCIPCSLGTKTPGNSGTCWAMVDKAALPLQFLSWRYRAMQGEVEQVHLEGKSLHPELKELVNPLRILLDSGNTRTFLLCPHIELGLSMQNIPIGLPLELPNLKYIELSNPMGRSTDDGVTRVPNSDEVASFA